MELLEHLTQEHRKAEDLMDRLGDTEPGPQRRQLIDDLTDALTVHMEVEERFLYPIVADALGSETEQEADTEHSLARDGLATLHDLADEPGFGAAVEMLKAGVGHHVREEEDEIFPKLRQQAPQVEGLDPEELETEVKQGRDGEPADEPTRDELYERARAAGIPGRSSMSKDELAAALDKA